MGKSAPVTISKERKKSSISLENFGQKKGHVRALSEFRNRKHKKRVETATRLRKYKKAMKSEGFQAGRGASRRRWGESEAEEEKLTEQNDDNISRRRKTNPLQKSIDKAEQKKKNVDAIKKSKDENEKEKRRKLRERKQQTKLLARRTKRGQPIMKHTVNNMLRKLERA